MRWVDPEDVGNPGLKSDLEIRRVIDAEVFYKLRQARKRDEHVVDHSQNFAERARPTGFLPDDENE